MVVWTILGHFGPVHFPTVPWPFPRFTLVNMPILGRNRLRVGLRSAQKLSHEKCLLLFASTSLSSQLSGTEENNELCQLKLVCRQPTPPVLVPRNASLPGSMEREIGPCQPIGGSRQGDIEAGPHDPPLATRSIKSRGAALLAPWSFFAYSLAFLLTVHRGAQTHFPTVSKNLQL